jgi:hypothetical protein
MWVIYYFQYIKMYEITKGRDYGYNVEFKKFIQNCSRKTSWKKKIGKPRRLSNVMIHLGERIRILQGG